VPHVLVAAGPGTSRVTHGCGQLRESELGNHGGCFSRVHPNRFLPARLVRIGWSGTAQLEAGVGVSGKRLTLDDLYIDQVEVNGMGIRREVEELPHFDRSRVNGLCHVRDIRQPPCSCSRVIHTPAARTRRLMMPMVMMTTMAMAMMMAPPTAVARRGGGSGGSGSGTGRGRRVGPDVVVKVAVVVLLLVVRLTRPSGHPGCLAWIICIENIPVTLSWRRPSESVSLWRHAFPWGAGPPVRAFSSSRRYALRSRPQSARAGLPEFLRCRQSSAFGRL